MTANRPMTEDERLLARFTDAELRHAQENLVSHLAHYKDEPDMVKMLQRELDEVNAEIKRRA